MPTQPQRLRSGFHQGTFNRSTIVDFGLFCLSVVFFLPLFFFSRFDKLSQIMKSTLADFEDILTGPPM